jgi:hypothetical protein
VGGILAYGDEQRGYLKQKGRGSKLRPFVIDRFASAAIIPKMRYEGHDAPMRFYLRKKSRLKHSLSTS